MTSVISGPKRPLKRAGRRAYGESPAAKGGAQRWHAPSVISAEKLTPHVGAVISGVDLSKPLDEGTFKSTSTTV